MAAIRSRTYFESPPASAARTRCRMRRGRSTGPCLYAMRQIHANRVSFPRRGGSPMLATTALALLALITPATQPTATMKAIRYHEHGPATVLRYEDAPRPTPGEGEMRVRADAAGVHP